MQPRKGLALEKLDEVVTVVATVWIMPEPRSSLRRSGWYRRGAGLHLFWLRRYRKSNFVRNCGLLGSTFGRLADVLSDVPGELAVAQASVIPTVVLIHDGHRPTGLNEMTKLIEAR